MLRIKLVRAGKKDHPTWRVVVVEKTRTGKGAATDYIGSYNPNVKPKAFKLDIEKYADWLKKGAQPTDSIKRLKGRYIDKSKDYQKEVGTKLYKSKKPEEEKKAEAPKVEKAEEPIVEEKAAEPTEQTAEQKEDTVEEKAE